MGSVLVGAALRGKNKPKWQGNKTPLQLLAPAKAAPAVELDRGIDDEKMSSYRWSAWEVN
jgi:hypothetical protein